MMKHSLNIKPFKNLFKKLLILIISLMILIQNFEAISALSLSHIDRLDNNVGPYYNKDINDNKHNTNNQLINNIQDDDKLSNIINFNYDEIDLDDDNDDDFIYEESLDERTTIYTSLNDSNLKRMEISSNPINYLDEDNNTYKPIDTSIIIKNDNNKDLSITNDYLLSNNNMNNNNHPIKDYQYLNETNIIKSYYDINIIDKGILFISNDLNLSYKPILDNEELSQIEDPYIYHNQIIYPLNNETNLRYTINNGFIKEDIILNTITNNNIYKYELDTNGRIELRNNILFLYNQDNKLSLMINAPKAYDSLNNETDINLVLEDNILTYIIDEEWLNSSDRIYPIIIDPTISIMAHEAYDISICENYPSYTIGNVDLESLNWLLSDILEARLYIGNDLEYGDSYSFYKIRDEVLAKLKGKYIKEAKTRFFVESSSSKSKLYSCNIKADINIENINYLTLATNNNLIDNNTCVISPYENNNWLYIDTTNYLKNIIEENHLNKGIFLMLENQKNDWLRLYASEYYNYELYHYGKATSGVYPGTTIEYYDHPDITINDLNDFTYNLRPFVKYNYLEGVARFIALGIDGKAPYQSDIYLTIKDNNSNIYSKKMSAIDNFFHYPDYPKIDDVPNKWTVLESNYQIDEFLDKFKKDKIYDIEIYAKKDNNTSKIKKTYFQLYESKNFDLLSNIANYYGVDINILKEDNNLIDELLTKDNLLFIREPKYHKGEAYPSKDLTDDEKKQIDAYLRGRNLQCEYGNEPINFNTGNFLIESSDLALQIEGETFYFSRIYNSKAHDDYSLNGYGWTNNLLSYIGISSSGAKVLLPNSKELYFKKDNNDNYLNSLTDQYKLIYDNNHFILRDLDEDITYNFLNTGLLSTITNHHNRTTTLKYNDNGQLLKIIFPNNLTLDFSYSKGLLTKISLSDNTSISYKYDENDNLISFIDQEGKIIKYNYDNKHRIISWINRNDELVITNTYDTNDRVIKQIDYLNNEFNIEYYDNQTINIDPLGNKTIYNYDKYGATTSIIYSDNNKVIKEYNNNLLIYEKLETGLEFNYSYNLNRDLIKKERSDGLIEEWTYDKNHNLLSYLNNMGQSISYTYDLNNNEIKKIDSEGNISYKTYDNNSNLLSETDNNGNITTYQYNDKNQLIKVIYPDSSYYLYNYDLDGYLSSTRDKYDNTTYLIHNKRNELVLITNPDNSTIKYEYDNNGNKIAYQNEKGYITRYTYDIYGNLLSTIDPKGNITSYEYDSNNNLIKTINPDNSYIINTYDDRNRIIFTLNNKHLTSYTYNNYGIETITNEKNQIKRYEYDDLGNIIKTIDFDGLITLNKYDNLSRLISTTNPKGITTTYEYDLLDRLIKEINPLKTISYLYDFNSNLLETRHESKDSLKIDKKIYNSMNKIIEEIDSLGNITKYEYDGSRLISFIDSNNNKTSYYYDKRDNIIKEELADKAYRSYLYDSLGNKIKEIDTNNNITTYIYDQNNNLIQIIDKEDNITNYSYDNMNRLISSISPLGYKESYLYDLDSNMIAKSLNDNIIEEYLYDEYNNLILEKINNLTTTYKYDEYNNIINKIDPYGLETNYKYDKYHRLIKTITNNEMASSFIYDEYDNILKERDLYNEIRINKYNDDLNLIETSYHNLTIKYEYDLLNRKIKEIDSLGNKKEIIYDSNSNIIKEIINNNVSSYEYDIDNNLIKEINTLGYITENTYDHEGNLLKIIDPNNNITTYTYNKNNLLTSISLNNKLISAYEYNEDSLLIKEIDEEGYNKQYLYDNNHNLIKEVDKKGYLTSYIYDEYFNLTEIINPLGYKTINTYNKLNQLIKTKDSKNNIYKYEYDIFNNLTKTTNPLGSTYISKYNSKNQLIITIDERGLETKYTYNTYNDILTVEIDDIISTTNEYDLCGRLISKTNSLNQKTSYLYDKEGNIISIIYPNNYKESFKYDSEKQLISSVDVLGVTTKLEYDKVGNNITKIIDNKRIIRNEYDEKGNIISLIDSNNNKTSFIYNKRNELIETIDPLGNIIINEYSPTGQIISIIDQNNNKKEFIYDELDRLIQTIDEEGNITTNTYDSLNNLISVQNPRGYKISYEYNPLGSLIKEKTANKEINYKYTKANDLIEIKAPNFKKESFKYDKKGNLLSYIRKDGSIINYTYDLENNIISKNNILYSYDEMNNLIKMIDDVGITEFTYNPLGSLTSTKQNDSLIKYEYNKYNELTKIIYPDNTYALYKYDNNSNLIEVKNNDLIINYEYDSLNREIRQIRSNGITTKTSYDKVGNINHLLTTSHNNLYYESYYYYNKNNSLIKEEINRLSELIIKEYDYNENDELISSLTTKNNESSKTEYLTSLEGNVFEIKDDKLEIYNEYNSLDQIIKSRYDNHEYTYIYDDNGNRIKEIRDDNKIREYEYNEYNNLLKLKDFDETIYEYTYDGLDHRLSQTISKQDKYYEINNYQSEEKINKLIKRLNLIKENNTICIIPYYNNDPFNKDEIKEDIINKLEETSKEKEYYDYYYKQDIIYKDNYYEKEVINNYQTDIKYINDYTCDNEIVLTMIQDNNHHNYLLGNNNNIISSDKENYITDYSNSIMMTLNLKGDLNTIYEYTDYGKRNINYDPFNQNTNQLGYNNEYLEAHGLIYLRARYYDPSSLSFISEDTYRGSLRDLTSRNRYSYVRNNPKKYSDPSGHWPDIKGFFNKAKETLSKAIDTTKTFITNTYNNVKKVVNDYVIKPAVNICKNVSNYINNVTTNIRQALNPPNNNNNNPINTISVTNNNINYLGNNNSNYNSHINKSLEIKKTEAKNKITNIFKNISNSFSKGIDNYKNKVDTIKVNISNKLNKLNNNFKVVKGSLSDRLRGLCRHSKQDNYIVPDTSIKNIKETSTNVSKDDNKGFWGSITSWASNTWDSTKKNVGEFINNPRKYIDDHLDDIAKVGIFVAGAAITIGTGGLALAAIAPGLAGTMGTISVIGGTIATIGGTITLGAGALQIGTAISGQTLDGSTIDTNERINRGINGALNVFKGTLSIIGGNKIVKNGKKLIDSAGETVRRSFKNWEDSEKYIADKVGGEPQKSFDTSLGVRRIDQFAKNIAHESKLGYKSLTKDIKTQILKDYELIQKKQIKKSIWHFFESEITGKGGASKPLIEFLKKHGIKYKIY